MNFPWSRKNKIQITPPHLDRGPDGALPERPSIQPPEGGGGQIVQPLGVKGGIPPAGQVAVNIPNPGDSLPHDRDLHALPTGLKKIPIIGAGGGPGGTNSMFTPPPPPAGHEAGGAVPIGVDDRPQPVGAAGSTGSGGLQAIDTAAPLNPHPHPLPPVHPMPGPGPGDPDMHPLGGGPHLPPDVAGGHVLPHPGPGWAPPPGHPTTAPGTTLSGGGLTDPLARNHPTHDHDNPFTGLSGDPRGDSGKA